MNEMHSNKLDEMGVNLKKEMDNLKTELNEKLDKSLQNFERKIDLVEKKADKGMRMAIESQKLCVNMMKQARFECCMDISGLKFKDEYADLKALAIDTIRSFKIKIDQADIKKVTSKDIKKPNSVINKILIVTFDDIDTKLRVMHEKNKIKQINGIFFNSTLTPANGYYMRKARYITKGTTLKIKFFDGAVKVKINDGNDMIIQSEESLQELKKFVDKNQVDMNMNQESPNASMQ